MAKYSFKGVRPFPERQRPSITGAWFKRRVEFFVPYVPNRGWAERLAGQFSLVRGSRNYQPGLFKSLKRVDADVVHIMETNKVTRRVALGVYWLELKKRYELMKAGVPLESDVEFMHNWLGDALYPED